MNTVLKGLAVGAALLVAAPAFAATVSSQAVFPSGQTQVYGNGGSTVTTNFQVHVLAGEVLHAIRTKVDGQATVCTPVGPFEGDQTVTVSPNITLPPNSNTGGYSLIADLFTTDTMPQAQAMSDVSLACSSAGSGAHVFTAAYNGSTVVNVLPTSGGSGSGSSPSNADLQALIAALTAQIQALQHPATPAPTPASTLCSQLANAMTGAQMGVYNNANQALQGFLLYQHMSIPALAAGASFGFFGQQTSAALSSFRSQNGCI